MWAAKLKIKNPEHHESGLQQINDALDLTLWHFFVLMVFFLISLWSFVPSGHEGTHSQASPFNSDLHCEQNPRFTVKMGQAAKFRCRGF